MFAEIYEDTAYGEYTEGRCGRLPGFVLSVFRANLLLSVPVSDSPS